MAGMGARTIGLLVVGVGLVAIVVGALIAMGALSWFGRLPGDIRIEGETTRVYIPITSMLLVSVALSVVLAILRRFLG
jgi:hypothetical protein